MTNVDEIDLEGLEERSRAQTAALVRQLFPFQAYPMRDSAGIVRHGIGRPIEKRPMAPPVAEAALMYDLTQTQKALRGRVFELIVRQPSFEPRLPYLYALGDIFGPEKLAGWSRLWVLLGIGDMEGMASELIVAQWDKMMGADEATRRLVFRIINQLQLGVPVSA